MRYWVNFLHFFQPPTQKDLIVKDVAEKNYRKVIDVLKENSKAKLVLNISACLTEKLYQYGFKSLLKDISTLAEKGQIEFVESAKYHPILQFLPKKEVVRQIELNHKTNKKYFGKVYNPKGFYPPELFYTPGLAKTVDELGYKFILACEISYKGKLRNIKFDRLYKPKITKDLLVIYQSRRMSRRLGFRERLTTKKFLNEVDKFLKPEEYLMTVADGEFFGHRYKKRDIFFANILKSRELKTITASELIEIYKDKVSVTSTKRGFNCMLEDKKSSKLDNLWKSPDNEIQLLKWKLTNLAIKTIENADPKEFGYREARGILDTFLYSCHYWWASCWPWWSIEEVEKGTRGLMMAIKSLRPKKYKKVQKKAEELYAEIMNIVVDWHLSGEAQRRIDDFDVKYKNKWLDI